MGQNDMLVTVIVFVVVSVVVGVIAKMLNGLAEANAVRRAEEERRARATRMERAAARARAAEDERAERPRPAARPRDRDDDGPRTSNPDMDRFLAEIDRLRRKATNQNQSAQSGAAAPVTPVVQPSKPASANRPRVVAELAEPPTATVVGPSFGTSPQAPQRAAPIAGQVEELPVAQVLKPSSSTGAPATKVTKFTSRPRPAAKTNFGKNLTAMLASNQGVAMAVVLQEILGPAKSRQNAANSPPPAPHHDPHPTNNGTPE